jgi:DNA repair exonuclease SbcCD nuclease subunit
MKIALITDTHFGARSDSLPFDNFFRKFYNEVFFPKLAQQHITTVIHLGDCFDRRKYINFNILKNCREYFFDRFEENGITVHMMAGNHDTYFKNTNDVNSPDLLLKDYNNIIIYDRPESLQLDHTSILMMPWICNDNYAACMEAIKQSTDPVLFGHLELAGFVMHKGQQNDEGMDPKIFDKFDLVCSGHFHHRSRKGNIQYLGNPYEMTWNDFDDPRGFHIFDTETLELEFIVNPYTMFEKFMYDDSKFDPDGIDVSAFADKNIKLVVVNKTDFAKFDAFVDRLYRAGLLELKIIEDFSEFEADALDDENLNLEDTLSLLNTFVDSTETDASKDRIKSLLKELYVEAQNSETV